MSAPDTNVEEQKHRHRPTLMILWGVLAMTGALALALLVWVFAQSDGPTTPEARIDGRTGEVVPVSDGL